MVAHAIVSSSPALCFQVMQMHHGPAGRRYLAAAPKREVRGCHLPCFSVIWPRAK